MKSYGRVEGWRDSSTILDLDTRCGWVVRFTPILLYFRHSVDTRMSGPQSRSGRYAGKKNLLILPRIELRPSSPEPAAIQTELFRLLCIPMCIYAINAIFIAYT
jgi:hypothetical protein